MAILCVLISWVVALLMLTLMGLHRYATAKTLLLVLSGLYVVGLIAAVLTSNTWGEAAIPIGMTASSVAIVSAVAWVMLRIQRNRYRRWAAIATIVSLPAFVVCAATSPTTKKVVADSPSAALKSIQAAPAQVPQQAIQTPAPPPIQYHAEPAPSSPYERIDRASTAAPVGPPAAAPPNQRPASRATYAAPAATSTNQPSLPSAAYSQPAPTRGGERPYVGAACPHGGQHTPGKVDRNGRTHCSRCGRLM